MVINDFQNLRLLHAVHGLGELVVVHQNDPLRVQIQEVSAAHDTDILSFGIKNGEVSVAHRRHDFLRVLDIGVEAELQQLLALHDVAHRNGRADEACRRIGVVGAHEHRAVLFLRAV